MNNKEISFIDICSGIGAAHLAGIQNDLNCIGYCEISEDAIQVYEKLHGNHYTNFGDVTQIDMQNVPDFDLLIGGFPCQSFSINGLRDGTDDERGQVIWGIAKLLEEKKPKFFLLENVKGLLNVRKGKDFKDIITVLNKLNYQIQYQVLNSKDFGIPQSRERVYIIGIRNDIYTKPYIFPHGVKSKSNQLQDFLIDNNPNLILDTDNKTFVKYLNNKYNINKFNIDELLQQDYLIIDTRQSDLRTYKDYIPTLRHGRHGLLYVKNKQLRKLSSIEAMLLQGFNNNIAMETKDVPMSKMLSLVGNSMTVPVMFELIKNIVEYNNG